MRGRRWSLFVLLLLVGVTAWVAFNSAIGGDYQGKECSTCDSARPAINALAAGNFHQFFKVQPVMGGFSLFLRGPFAALSGNDLVRYRVGSFVLLLMVAVIAWWLTRVLAERGRGPVVQLTVAALLVASPLTFQAMHWGHPEEPLAAALCVAAVVLAGRKQAILAGVALGLALATKQWALLAVAPTVMLAEGCRRRMLVATVASAAVFTVPMMLGDPHRYFYLALNYSGSSGHPWLTPANIWWSLGGRVHTFLNGFPVDRWRLPTSLASVSHPLIIGLVAVITVAYWRGGMKRDASGVLRLLALIFLLRCMLDTMTYGYHHLPLLFTLAAAEGLSRRRLPWAAIALAVATWVMNSVIAPMGDPYLVNHVYLAWATPLLIYLLVTALHVPLPTLRIGRVRAPGVA